VPTSTESRAEQQFRKGLRLAEAHKLDAAAAIFLRLTQEYPRLLEPYVQLAAVYQQQGNTQRAVDVLRAALRVHTDAARLQEQLGDLYLQLAARAYRAALDVEHATASARTKYTTLEALGVEKR
jgi:tetratricopeptide (TPR) repeat protein